MQKWEYLIIRGQGYGGVWRPLFVSGQQLKGWENLSLESVINQLGDDGWELVCFLGHRADVYQDELIFKRPKP